MRIWVSAIGVLHGLCVSQSGAAAPFEIVRTNQPGWTITWEGRVDYLAPERAPAPARTNQLLNFGDALQTLALSRAVVRLQDWSDLRLKDRTRLEIAMVAPSSPGLKLTEGQIYFSSRGGPQGLPVETPHARGVPKGTEFVVRVEAGQTEVTMFDGEVELSNGVEMQPVRSGQQGIVVPGQPILIRPILEAQNIVQWWIYYPAVLDPKDLGLTPPEAGALAESLGAYRRGQLVGALQRFPGYPTPQPVDPASDAQRAYLAALFLSVGSVDRAERELAASGENTPAARALRTMIAAVAPPLTNGAPVRPPSLPSVPLAGSEWVALSYAHQATNNLPAALAAARAACAASSEFGFAWARVAELEFSFGRTRAARVAVERALQLSPDNAQAHAVHGFLLAADYRMGEAIAAFDQAIAIDPALGNAWLGRGLCKRRLGWFQRGGADSPVPARPSGGGEREGTAAPSQVGNRNTKIDDWLADLQTAAALEPHRSLVRSYAGKAFGEVGRGSLAAKEFQFAKQLDPNDPTPWLYSALELWRNNRVNEAVRDLERSIELNDNRAVYRSRLLLDQDQATRSVGLAKIYQSAGLEDVAWREASRAVSYDYANHSAHQFLAESYDALRDPARFNLRYETAWFNEVLLANVLSPAGAGLLSQNISQQEYTRLFEHNRVGLTSATEVRSDRRIREITSHYGVLGRTAYTLDLDYQHNDERRINDDLDRIDWYSQVKQQLNERDSVFLLAKYQEYEAGDHFQAANPTPVRPYYRLEERQAPLAYAAWHREWAPGHHTVLSIGRIESEQRATDRQVDQGVLTVDASGQPLEDRLRFTPLDVDYRSRFATWLGEISQIADTERQTAVVGVRAQSGEFTSRAVLTNSLLFANYFLNPPARGTVTEDFERVSAYGYETLKIGETWRLTAGLTYDYLAYPANLRWAPLSSGRDVRRRLSPKSALVWSPWPRFTVRGLYSRAQGGVSFDDNFRLEPVQLAGFSQAYRSVISEAEVGTVTAPRHEIAGIAADGRWGRNAFWGVEAQRIVSVVSGTIGIFTDRQFLQPPPYLIPGQVERRFDYEEHSVRAGLGCLVGETISLGASYRFTTAELRTRLDVFPESDQVTSRLQEARVFGQWQHPAGALARAEVVGWAQDNDGYQPERPNEMLGHGNVFVGWRMNRRRGEITFGCLNVTGASDRLSALTFHNELPRERVWLARLSLRF